ncbi:MAG: hypothetical protein WAT12_07215 [Candidatus Nitrotoga sp.]
MVDRDDVIPWLVQKKSKSSGSAYILEEQSFAIITGISVEADSDPELGNYIYVDGKFIKHTNTASVRILKSHLSKYRKQPILDQQFLFQNICTIGRILRLSDAEMSILCFAAVIEIFPAFYAVLASVSFSVSLQRLGSIIALISGQPHCEVMSGLRDGSTLVSSGIVEIESTYRRLEDKLTLLSGLGEILFQAHDNDDALIGKFLQKASAPGLTL